MGRTRYKIYEPTHPHFITLTILHWIPIFTNRDSVQIVIDSIKYLQKQDNLKIYAFVILENHIHLVASSNDIIKTMQKFKSYTAKELLKLNSFQSSSFGMHTNINRTKIKLSHKITTKQ